VVQRLIYSQNQKIGAVILVRSLDDLKSMQDEYKKLTFTIWLIIVILVIFAALWIEKSLTKPLLELVSVAEKVASEKDLQARAKKMSDDEFGRLTSVFNAMLDSIGEANAKLIESKEQMETRVIERTDDLKKANERLESEIKVRIKKNQELLNLQNQLGRQERLANVGQVSSNIAHELRNPMAAIRNSVYFLRNNLSTPDKSLEHLEIIDQQLSASDEVIEHLLNITKGKELKLSAVNLKELCVNVLEVLNLSDQVKFSYKSEPKNLELTVDKLLFRQIISNLFINSIQSNDLISDVKIEIIAMKKKEFIEILITDNGTGIPQELQSRVFEPLYTDKEDGFGLGLALCSDLLARHRGSIEIKESSAKGTTISLKIPN
jgi:nitrogen fixation/metabolism regulation signal transduction histidine kinase